MLMFKRISELHVINAVMLTGMAFVLLAVPELFVYLCVLLYYIILLLCINRRALAIGTP